MKAVIVQIKSSDKEECEKLISFFTKGGGKFMKKYDFSVTELKSTKSKQNGEVFEIELSLYGEIQLDDLLEEI